MANTNPALLLHARLAQWNKAPGVMPMERRAEGQRSWQEIHLETLAWVAEVKAHLETVAELNDNDAGPEIGDLTDNLLEGIFATEGGLREKDVRRQFFDPKTLLALKLVGATWKTVPPNPEALTELLDAAQKAQRLIMGATHLPEDARHYLTQLNW